MLVRIGAPQREEHPAALESGDIQETFSQRRARLCAPARIHEAQSLRLLLNGAYQARVLMTQVHALRQAAHVEIGAARLIPEPCSLSADDGRRVPIRLNAPALEDARVFRNEGIPRNL